MDRAGPWTLWLLLWSTPLIFLPGLTDNFRPPKLYAAELLGLLSLALLSLRLLRAPTIDVGSVLRRPVVWALLALPTLATLSGLWSEHGAHVRRALPSLWIAVACLLGWMLALTAEERRRLLRALVLPATLLSFLAILQFHGLFDPFTFERRLTQRLALTSLAGGAFDLAGYLLLPLLVTQAWLRSATGRLRTALIVALGVCVYGLLLTQTLTAVIAAVVSAVVYWAPTVPRRRLVAGAVAVIVLGLAVSFVGPLRPRVTSKLESLQKGEINRLLTGRLDGWHAAVHMARENPVTGVGHGAFRAEFGDARMELKEAGVRFFRGQHQVFFVNAHNEFLEVAAEWGLPGAALLAWALWTLWRARSRRPPGAGHEDEIRGLEPAACAGLVILASTHFPLHVALIAYPWLLFFSGLAAPAAGDPAADEGDAETASVSSRAVAVAAVVLFVVAAWIRLGAARDLMGADRLVVLVEGRSQAIVAAGGRVPARVLQQNIDMMKRAQELDPASVSPPLALGGQYMLMKRYDAAIRSLEEAIELEPRAEPYANLAQCYLALGENEKAMEAIDKAIQLDHNQGKTFRSILKRERRHRQWQERQKDEDS